MMERIFSFDPNSPLLFTQFYFWAFFALVYAVFALIGDRRLLRNSFLFFVSLFFYFKTSGLSVLILIFVTVSDFLIARRMSGQEGWKRKFWLCMSLCIDLGLLWDICDTFNGLMAIPNLIAVALLSPVAIRLIRDYVDKKPEAALKR